MKKSFLFVCVLLSLPMLNAQRRMENLDRGLVASKVANGVYVNWRITGQEWQGVSYNLYRDGVKINGAPISGASNYLDAAGVESSQYAVSAIVGGVEQALSGAKAVLPNPYIEFDLQPIPKIAGVPDSYYNQYITNDIVVGDLDGDGEYELIVKRMNEGYESSKPFENQYYTLFDAYKLDGTFLWRIDVGPNLFHNVEINALVYDLDGDGKAEVVMRTSEGTKDGPGNVIPDLGNAQGANVPDGKTNYRDKLQNNGQWFEYEGPEYLSLFDGETGAMLDRIDHIARQPVSQWGAAGTGAGGLAHRACKYHYGVPYLDGKKPSLFVSRGIYYRTKMATYDIVAKKFVSRWTYDSGTGAYCGQGNHNFSIADVDNDGRDEIVYGSMTIDDDGQGLYSTGLGHGDAIHVGDFDPYRKGLEVFACLEEAPYFGSTFRAAESGEILLQYIAGSDCGRAMAANVTDKFKGAELWPSKSSSFSASERKEIAFTGGSSNFRIFWDGDLMDELVDHNFSSALGKGVGIVQKYNGSSWQNLLVTTGYYSCNYTKGTPCLQADLLGDWREELIYKSADENKIRIYFTTISTAHRIYTLMHDMQYRQAIAWQMCGYNQPPHVSFFLGEAEGIVLPPPPVMDNQKQVFNPTSGSWNNTTYPDGQEILFDVSGHSAGNITLTGTVSPRNVTVNSPEDYAFDMSAGELTGSMKLIKQGKGVLTFNGSHNYSDTTELWDGLTVFDGALSNSSVWLNRFAELAAKGTLAKNVSLNYGSILYPGLKEMPGTLTTGGDIDLKENAVLEFDLDNSSALSDKIILTGGTLRVADKAVLRIKKTADITPGDYSLIQVANIDGDISNVIIEGLNTQITSLSHSGGNIVLSVQNMRSSESVVWKGGHAGFVWNMAEDENFTFNGSDVYFALGDAVTFDDTSLSKTVNKEGKLSTGSVLVDTEGDYVIQGSGTITGSGTLTKSGSGKLTLKGTNEYSGATLVNGGTLAVESMPYLTYSGSIGFSSSNPDLFVIDGGTFTSTGTALSSFKALKLGTNGATINTNADFEWNERITGSVLTKTGTRDLAFFGANNFDKLIIKAGTVTLKTEETNPGKTVVFEAGTLKTYDNSGTYSTATWNIEVPEGKSGTINLDSRCDYKGTLTGAGNLTVMSPFVRSELSGNWSAFTGKITATSDADGGDLRFNNNHGIPNAELNITGKLSVYNNTGGTFAIGALTGTVDATLTGSHQWTIGNKNVATTFAGKITAGSVRKVGTAALTLSNANTYTGTTTIAAGRLLATNTTGSATGTGTVSVESDACLGGTGNINGNTTVKNGATIESGNNASTSAAQKIGTLTFEKNLTLQSGATTQLDVRSRTGNPCDKIVVKGTFTAAGKLELTKLDGVDFPIGVELKLLDCTGTISGQFDTVDLPAVANGAVWDTTQLLTNGTIKVIAAAGETNILPVESNALRVYPNPAKNVIHVKFSGAAVAQIDILDLTGEILLSKEVSSQEAIDITDLKQGIYILRTNLGGKTHSAKVIKNLP